MKHTPQGGPIELPAKLPDEQIYGKAAKSPQIIWNFS